MKVTDECGSGEDVVRMMEERAEPRLSVTGHWAYFDDMGWPTGTDVGREDRPLGWALRYSEPTRSEILEAASIIDAYRELVLFANRRKRDSVISKIRRAIDATRKTQSQGRGSR